MFIVYKSYRSSGLASFISFFSSCAFLFGGCTLLLLLFEIGSGINLEYLICSIIFLPAGFGLRVAAKAIAEEAHMRKLRNNAKYARDYVASHPEAKEFCIQNNPKYAQMCMSQIGQANFNPNDYEPR